MNQTVVRSTRANAERIVPNIVSNVERGHSYLVAGHGGHRRGSGYFPVPDGKYVVFFSSPGVPLSENLIANSKFQTMLQTPLHLKEFLLGTLNRNKVPNFLRYSRTNFNWKKTLYSPRTPCPDMHIQFWDRTEPRNTNGNGVLQRYMGVWKLPDFSPRKYVNKVKTLKDIVTNGPAGVYFVYACRITPGDVNWGNVNGVYNRARVVLPGLVNYRTWLGSRMNTNNMINNYLAHLRSRLQNIGRLNLAPIATVHGQNIQARESELYRVMHRKRTATSTGPRKTARPTQQGPRSRE